MSRWIKIDSESKFGEDVKVYQVNENRIAVFQLEDGFYAIEDTCSHEEASLSQGEVEEGVVECPLHGARFDIRSGRNLSFPAVIPVKSYAVKTENGEIFIEIED